MSAPQQASQEAARFVAKVNEIILFPFIALLLGIAFLIFIWGCAQYIMNADAPAAREEGKKHILYGIVGLVVMVSAYALIKIGIATFGLTGQLDCATNPSAGNCEQMFRVQ